MAFRRVHTDYEPRSEGAYVELRAPDSDGGEIVVVAIFSYRTTPRLTNTQIEREIRRKAMHAFKSAAKV